MSVGQVDESTVYFKRENLVWPWLVIFASARYHRHVLFSPLQPLGSIFPTDRDITRTLLTCTSPEMTTYESISRKETMSLLLHSSSTFTFSRSGL